MSVPVLPGIDGVVKVWNNHIDYFYHIGYITGHGEA